MWYNIIPVDPSLSAEVVRIGTIQSLLRLTDVETHSTPNSDVLHLILMRHYRESLCLQWVMSKFLPYRSALRISSRHCPCKATRAMPAISTQSFSKIFATRRKAGSLYALVRSPMQTLEAVRDISFETEAGELLDFIGPNGAGKSTSIKIVTGILYAGGGRSRSWAICPGRSN